MTVTPRHLAATTTATRLLDDDRIAREAVWVWRTLPRRLVRRYPVFEGIAGDGHWLMVNPQLALFLPLACLLGGFLIGAVHPGFETMLTESVFWVTTLLALGAFSTQLGLLAVVGYALGDFFVRVPLLSVPVSSSPVGGDGPDLSIFDTGINMTVRYGRLPMLISYLVLALGVAFLPCLARRIAALVLRTWRVDDRRAWLVASCAYVAALWFAITGWAAALPLMVRPWWLLEFQSAIGGPIGAGSPAFIYVMTFRRELVAAAVVGSIVRQLIVARILASLSAGERLEVLDAQAAPNAPLPAATRTQLVWRSLAGAVLGTLLIAGILDRLWTLVLAGLLFFAVALLRTQVWRPSWILRWTAPLTRFPIITRVLALVVAIRLFAEVLSEPVLESHQDLSIFVVISAAVGALVLMRQPDEPAPRRAWRPGALLCVALGIGLGLLVVLDSTDGGAISEAWVPHGSEPIAAWALAAGAAVLPSLRPRPGGV